eukprot:COSAG02_NODE_571_length_20173_cov_14.694032_7_plen_170_part_00
MARRRKAQRAKSDARRRRIGAARAGARSIRSTYARVSGTVSRGTMRACVPVHAHVCMRCVGRAGPDKRPNLGTAHGRTDSTDPSPDSAAYRPASGMQRTSVNHGRQQVHACDADGSMPHVLVPPRTASARRDRRADGRRHAVADAQPSPAKCAKQLSAASISNYAYMRV